MLARIMKRGTTLIWVWSCGAVALTLAGLVTAQIWVTPELSRAAQPACLPNGAAPVSLPGGTTYIGADDSYPEEAPRRMAKVGDFSIDATEVTNRQFARFIDETGYVTDAERAQPGFGVPGGAVFTLPTVDNPSWWRFVANANWRQPEGPESNIEGRDSEPVVQVSLADARAYAQWAGRRLPTEAEWEYAARAGSQTRYVWGDTRTPEGREMANGWQGTFPLQNTQADGYGLRAPVGCFPPNGFGLYDMIGNVWEWTETPWSPSPRDVTEHAIKGGSFLCAPNFCHRTRAPARQAHDTTFSTNHLGFRTIGD